MPKRKEVKKRKITKKKSFSKPPFHSLHRSRTPKARRRAILERLLNTLPRPIHPQTRHRRRPKEKHQIKQLIHHIPREEPAFPAGEVAPCVALLVDLRVDAHLVAEEEEGREGVGELHDADCGDEGGDGLDLRDGGADDEGEGPVDDDDDWRS